MMSNRVLFGFWLGLMVGLIVNELLFGRNWKRAWDRAYYQTIALIGLWLLLWVSKP